MKKRIYLLLIILISISLTGCSNIENKKTQSTAKILNENSNLELGLLENIEGKDLSKFEMEKGFGVRIYTSHDPVVKYELEEAKKFGTITEYHATSWPDYSDDGSYITYIYTENPEINIFGITVFSSSEKAREIFKEYGYKELAHNCSDVCVEKDGVSIRFHPSTIEEAGSIRIYVDVTNKYGVMF